MNFKGLVRNNKGITLVALIVTIVLLIIIAGVSIRMLTGEDGIITKAIEGKKTMVKENIKEVVKMDLIGSTLDTGNTRTIEDNKTQLVSKLREGKLIDDNTEIVNGFVVIDNNNIVSLYTGDDAIVADSSEWEYMTYDYFGESPTPAYKVEGIMTGRDSYTSVNYTIQEAGNENNKVAAIIGYKGTSRDIVIPEVVIDNDEVIPVTRLGDYGQPDRQNFTTVNVSKIKVLDNIKLITPWTFYGNTNLESISISDSVELIGDGAFCGCTNLRNVEFGKNIKWIGHTAFQRSSIEKLNLPESLTIIGKEAFEECNNIKNLKLSQNISTLGYACFRKCLGLEYITFNSTLTEISEECFACDNSLREINIPSNIRRIDDGAFMYVGHKYEDTNVGYGSNIAPKLEKIILNEGLQEVGVEAFVQAKTVKNNLRLPSTLSLSNIGRDAFLYYGTIGGGILYRSEGSLY